MTLTIEAREPVPHVYQEGSRQHVLHWDTDGAHCSEPNCEINKYRQFEEGEGTRCSENS